MRGEGAAGRAGSSEGRGGLRISHIRGASDGGSLDSDLALMWCFGQWVLVGGARGCRVHSGHRGDL